MKVSRAGLCLVVQMAASSWALAQGAASPTPPPEWSGEGGLSYVRNTGNSDNSTIGAALKAVHQQERWKASVAASLIRATDHDVKTAERLDAALRAERSLGARFSVYGQSTYLRNLFAGIDGQEALEGGGLYKLALGPTHFLSASASLSHVWEQRVAPEPNQSFLGARGALAYKWHISANADFTEDLDYLQSFEHSDDWRLGSKAAITASISRVLSLKLSHLLLRYNRPVPGKEKTDTTVLASIVAKWPGSVK
jgi:putative salt-induced outer membrane protein